MEQSQDFEEFFELLNKNDPKYLVVGGYAYAIHAEPRFTKDLEIFIKNSPQNAKKMIRVLDEFGFGSLDISHRDFLEPGQVIQLGNPPIRIDLLTSISGVTFEEAWENKVLGKYGNQEVYFIGKQELRKNKKATGRKSDIEDLDGLE